MGAVMADQKIHQNAETPYFLQVILESESFNLSGITDGEFDVVFPDDTTATWTATVTGVPTASAVTLKYTFQAGDLAQKGRYIVLAKTTAGTVLQAEKAITFTVFNPIDESRAFAA